MDIPVLCLDTCVVLDILRDPARKDVRVHEHEASLALLSAAQSGTALETLVAEQVSREFQDNVEQVHQDAKRSIGALTRQIGKLNALVALYGAPRPIDLGHWNDHDLRSRNAAERWLQVGTTVRQTSNTVSNAFLRLNQALTPASRGKQSMKDCVILETYLEHIQSLRARGRTAPAVFVSSNTKDYAAADKTTIRDDIKGEFQSLGLEYAPSMGAARGILKL